MMVGSLLIANMLLMLILTPLFAQTPIGVLTQDDRLLYMGYEVEKRYDPEGDFWFAVLKKGDEVLATFDRGYTKEWTSFGLFPFLGKDTKQVIVEQFSGGAHCCWSYWIVDLSPDLGVVYDSQEYPVGYTLDALDLDKDGVFEFTQGLRTFEYFNRLCYAISPIPTVVFGYDLERNRYLPISHMFPECLLKGIENDIERVKQFQEKTDFVAYDDSSGDYLSLVLQVVLCYVYAGQEEKAWLFYDREYNLPDKEEMKSKIEKQLEHCLVYQEIYDR